MELDKLKELERLNSEINLKNLFEREALEAESNVSEAVYNLFEPHLAVLQKQITKAGFELRIQAWPERKFTSLNPFKIEGTAKDIIKLIFHWEPEGDGIMYKEVKFSPRQKIVVNSILVGFAREIGFDVEVAED